MSILSSVAGFRWTSGNCDKYHRLSDTKNILENNDLSWDNSKKLTLIQFKREMVDKFLQLLYQTDNGQPDTDKLYLGIQQYKLEKYFNKQHSKPTLDRHVKWKDGAKVLEQEFAREFVGHTIDINSTPNEKDFKIEVRKQLDKNYPKYKALMDKCKELKDIYRSAEDDGVFDQYAAQYAEEFGNKFENNLENNEKKNVKSYFIPSGLQNIELIRPKVDKEVDKEVCARFTIACGIYTLRLPSLIKRIVSLWFDEYIGNKKKLTVNMLNNLKKLMKREKRSEEGKDIPPGPNFCLLSGDKSNVVDEHLVEYSQAGIVLTPLGTQYPFGYIDGILNGGILNSRKLSTESAFKQHGNIINSVLFTQLTDKINKILGPKNEHSPLMWKINGYVGRLLLQCVITSSNDNEKLRREDYNRFLYLLDIYYKTECALRSDEAMDVTATTLQEIGEDFFAHVNPQIRQFNAVRSNPDAVMKNKDQGEEQEEEEEEEEEERVTAEDHRKSGIDALKNKLHMIATDTGINRESIGKGMTGGGHEEVARATQYIEYLYSNNGSYINDITLALPADQWDTMKINLFGILVDTYIREEETTIDLGDIDDITYPQYSDVMRFFFTILEIYNIDFDPAYLQFDFETRIFKEMEQNSGIKSYLLHYIYEKVDFINRLYTDVMSEREAATPAAPSLRELMARPDPGVGLLTHDDVLGTVDASKTTGEEVIEPDEPDEVGDGLSSLISGDSGDQIAEVQEIQGARITTDNPDGSGGADMEHDAGPHGGGVAAVSQEAADQAAQVAADSRNAWREREAKAVSRENYAPPPNMMEVELPSTGSKRGVNGSGGKKTRKQKKRIHKKSRRKPRKSVSPGRWLRKPKHYSRNKRFKLRKRNTQNRKTKKRKTTRRKKKN